MTHTYRERRAITVIRCRLATVLTSYCRCNKLLQTQQLNTTQCIILQSWRSEVQNGSHRAKMKVLAGLHSFLETVSENLFSCLFLLLEAAYMCWPMAHFHHQSQQWPVKPFSNGITLTLTLLPPSFVFKGPYDYIGPTWIIKDNISISGSADQQP